MVRDRHNRTKSGEEHIFGNLEDWGRVLTRLGGLSRTGQLEQHQDALAGLLRYRDNWRLREAALESVRSIRRPTKSLLGEVSRIMADRELYFQIRVMAAETLGGAVNRLAGCSAAEALTIRRGIRRQMQALLDSPDVPVVHQTAQRLLPQVNGPPLRSRRSAARRT